MRDQRTRNPDQRLDEQAVYVIKHPHDFFKIGISKRPASRMGDLQIGAPYELTLVGVIEAVDARAVEKTLHSRYRNVRGEWFRLNEREQTRLMTLEDFDKHSVRWRYEDADERKRETLKLQGLIG